MEFLPLGTQVSDFTLNNQNDEAISLSQFAGKKVLVYFYPKAMTPGCTVQAQHLRDIKEELEAHNVVVLGVSPDPVKRLAKFAQRDELNFHLLSDEDHAIADRFGIWGLKKFAGREYEGIHRISFMISESGTVDHIFDKFKTKDHHTAILSHLES
ncbi:thioredoxin-dependent thiol peroxidase [Shewanella sp. S1-49-MNA-CIBAN-0167]|uniref:thioredoxin-dependent thiol peroxidase n=1 Tax=Shewanella sp. S1-49-MNA-CIBAN-0167 TaxID=3140468 RepID=UPI00332104D1